MGVGVPACVCGCVGVVLAVNVEAVKGRNLSNVCAQISISEVTFYDALLRFTLFHLYILTFVVLNCLLVIFIVVFG